MRQLLVTWGTDIMPPQYSWPDIYSVAAGAAPDLHTMVCSGQCYIQRDLHHADLLFFVVVVVVVCLFVLFLALLCATAQQSACRHAGVCLQSVVRLSSLRSLSVDWNFNLFLALLICEQCSWNRNSVVRPSCVSQFSPNLMHGFQILVVDSPGPYARTFLFFIF